MDRWDPYSLAWRRLPPSFRRRVVVLAEHELRLHDAEDWRDAVIVVAQGQVVLTTLRGLRQPLACGEVFWLDGLGVHALHNPAAAPAVLVAIGRRVVGDR